MRIGIIGSRGIPNNYGGFEQFAEELSKRLNQKNHEVFVYTSSQNPYKMNTFNNINLIRVPDPKIILGTASQFIYDLLCIIHSRKMNFDILLSLGYASSFIWQKLYPKNQKIFCHLDGLEWSRNKYGSFTKIFIKYGERITVESGFKLIADSPLIKRYIQEEYNARSIYIPYGANIFCAPNKKILKKFKLEIEDYDLVIARLVPENNIEMIISGFLKSDHRKKLVLIGDDQSTYANQLKKKFKNNSIIFLGKIYNREVLNNLRYFAHLYFHGHSVGGTNPSLLEAMACSTIICAHNNDFNRYVLENNAMYFKSSDDIKKIIGLNISKTSVFQKLDNNIKRIKSEFSWDIVADKYMELFLNSNY